MIAADEVDEPDEQDEQDRGSHTKRNARTSRLLLGFVVICACERAGSRHRDDAAPLPRRDAAGDAAVDAADRLKIIYAARTDDARTGANNTYFSIVEDEAFFVVADATRPAASKRAGELMSTLATTTCHAADDELSCIVGGANAQLARDHMTTAIAAVIVHDNRAFVTRAGDTVVGWIHGGSVSVFAESSPPLGTSRHWNWKVVTSELELARGDTLAIMTKRLLDVVGRERIRATLPASESDKRGVEHATEDLLRLATQAGRSDDAFSAIVIHVVGPN